MKSASRSVSVAKPKKIVLGAATASEIRAAVGVTAEDIRRVDAVLRRMEARNQRRRAVKSGRNAPKTRAGSK